MTYRLAKKRALQKAGFVHVAGWVRVEDAPAIQEKIDAAAPEVTRLATTGGDNETMDIATD